MVDVSIAMFVYQRASQIKNLLSCFLVNPQVKTWYIWRIYRDRSANVDLKKIGFNVFRKGRSFETALLLVNAFQVDEHKNTPIHVKVSTLSTPKNHLQKPEAMKRTLFVWLPKRFFFDTLYFSRYCENRFPYGTPLLTSYKPSPDFISIQPPVRCTQCWRCKSFQLRKGKAATCLFELEGTRRANRDGVTTMDFFVGNPSDPAENPLQRFHLNCGFLEIYVYIRRGLI